jgi:hypothetical protein
VPVQQVYCKLRDMLLGKRHHQQVDHSLQQAGNGKNAKVEMGGKSRGC